MISTPTVTDATIRVSVGRSLVAALLWAARVASSMFAPPTYARADLDQKFIRATDSPRSRLRSKRRGQTKTTESRS